MLRSWPIGTLTELTSQPFGGQRGKIPRVVFEDDVDLIRFPGEAERTFGHLGDLRVAVVVAEPLGHCFAGQVRLRVAPVQPQVRQPPVRDLVHGSVRRRRATVTRRADPSGTVSPGRTPARSRKQCRRGWQRYSWGVLARYS